jgi:hypothetical protein
VGAFDTRRLSTPGQLAASAFNSLSLLSCLLVTFFLVESLERETAERTAPLVWSSPASTAGLLAGKLAGNGALALGLFAATLAGDAVALAVQGTVPFRPAPFLLLWGLILPTLAAWSAFLAAAWAAIGNRYLTYGVGLGAVSLTLYRQLTGETTWVGNWLMWGTVRWSDMAPFELDLRAVVLNRLLVLGLAALFFVVAVRLLPRRRADAAARAARLRPAPLARRGLRLAPWAALPLVAGTLLWQGVLGGSGGEAAEKADADYWKENVATWRDAPQPDLLAVDLALDLDPARGRLASRGSFRLRNGEEAPMARFALTGGRHWRDLAWTLDGAPYAPDDRSRLHVFTPPAPIPPGGVVTVGFAFAGRFPDGVSANGGGAREFVLPSAVVLTSLSAAFAPIVGYDESIGLEGERLMNPPDRDPGFHRETVPPALGSRAPFATRLAVTAPADLQVNAVGTLVETRDAAPGRRTWVWESDRPVRFYNVVAGRWQERRLEGVAVHHHPGHAYNVEEIATTLAAARRWYSEWFYPYPWRELRLSEFPALASYAQGFPTNITFSEGIGFLTRPEAKADAVRLVTAHEAAHQWWGNLLIPGRGPGGIVLAEGMSHFSALLLVEQLRGEHARRELARRFERRYADERRADAERPIVAVDSTQPGDGAVVYEKGGWAMWMLLRHLGREPTLAGLREFIGRFKDGPDYPLVEDLLATLRPHAADPAAFDRFVDAWFFRVEVPEFRLTAARAEAAAGGGFHATATIENAGTGTHAVTVAAVAGEPFDEVGAPRADYREARTVVTVGPGERRPFEIACDFEPERIVVDPGVDLLQLAREKAVAEI